MILCIDGIYFNPLQITGLTQSGQDVLVYFSGENSYFLFENWNIDNLAAELNRLIQEYQDEQIRLTLWEMQQSLNRIEEGIVALRTGTP